MGRFLPRLAQLGHKPGQRWGREFYLDMIQFLTRVAIATGGDSFELGLRVAVKQLDRERDGEVIEDDVDEDWLSGQFPGVRGTVLDAAELVDPSFLDGGPVVKKGDDLAEVLKREFG